jgi:hypothetical protein
MPHVIQGISDGVEVRIVSSLRCYLVCLLWIVL